MLKYVTSLYRSLFFGYSVETASQFKSVLHFCTQFILLDLRWKTHVLVRFLAYTCLTVACDVFLEHWLINLTFPEAVSG